MRTWGSQIEVVAIFVRGLAGTTTGAAIMELPR